MREKFASGGARAELKRLSDVAYAEHLAWLEGWWHESVRVVSDLLGKGFRHPATERPGSLARHASDWIRTASERLTRNLLTPAPLETPCPEPS